MTITFPISLPASPAPRSLVLRAYDAAAVAESPFSLVQDVQEFGGQRWELDVELPPMKRVDAAAWVAALKSLRGRRGTFLYGPVVEASPQGTWAGTPLVDGAHAAGATAVSLKGLDASATIKADDYFNFGTGSSTRLHSALADATADGSGDVTIDIWPHLRAALADEAAIVSSSPKGIWRLASNTRQWDIGLAQIYGIRFVAVEAL